MSARNGSSASLVIEEKPICGGAIAHCLRSHCGADEVRLEKSIDSEKVRSTEGPYAVVLVDLATINYDFDALATLVARLGPSPVVAIDDRPNPAFSCIAETINCRGYVAKTFEEERIVQAVQSVMSGQTWFQISCGDEGGPPDVCHARPSTVLTDRQSAVLACVARGLSNDEIALQLGICVGTVKTHIHTILRRIGARNRTEAAILAPRFHAHGK